MLAPTEAEARRGQELVARVLQFTRDGLTIRLPDYEGRSAGSADYALLALEPNDFSGEVDEYRYQFEGEDDLLHLAVMRKSGHELTVEEARHVVHFLLPQVAPALIWLRPGTVSQHFYVGHEEVAGAGDG